MIRFELRRALRDRTTWFVLSLFALICASGAYFYWSALPPRPTGSRMVSDAYVFSLALGFHLGIANDRIAGFDTYLTSNLVQPRDLYIGKVLGGVMFLFGFALFALVVSVTTALGDVRFAAPLIGRLLAFSIFIVPVIIAFEVVVPTRYPALLVATLTLFSLMMASQVWEQKKFMAVTGIDGRFTAAELMLRGMVAVVMIVALYPVYRLRFRTSTPTRL